MLRLRAFTVPAVLCLALATAFGCGGGGPKPQPKGEANLQALAVLYGRFLQQNRGQSPPDEKTFKAFIAQLNPQELSTFGLTKADEAFVSPRDQQPYVVRYNVPSLAPTPQGMPVIAYEATGVGGERYVAFASGGIEKVDEARFRQLVPAAP
jgi:hypothetical protein